MRAAHRFVVILAIPVVLAATSVAAEAARPHGTICTSSGSPVYDFELAQLISSHVPKCTKKLIVLTECYGGDVVNDFSRSPNTAVISATKPGQLAVYGGYDDDAAAALRPGPGRNGNNVHIAGRNGRAKSETPTRGGTMSAGNFNLDNVTDNGPVRSRHVVYFAGKPNGMDNAYENTIRNNFAGQANTTVHSAGGSGGGGYNYPGTAAGLHSAIDDASSAITSSPDPCKEQFILFVSDHGDLEKMTASDVREILRGEKVVTVVPGFVSNVEANREDFLATADNMTSYSVLLPLGSTGMTWNPDEGRMLSGGDLVLEIVSEDFYMEISEFRELYTDYDGSGIVGDFPMDAILIEFDVPEDVFLEMFFDHELTVTLSNESEYSLPIGYQGLHSGEMAKSEEFEPGCIADFNMDGVVEDVDIEAFLEAFESCSEDADLNGSGEVEEEDMMFFMQHFDEGC